ncbi:MAG: ATP-binding protein [Anaerolineaceae bacterium]
MANHYHPLQQGNYPLLDAGTIAARFEDWKLAFDNLSQTIRSSIIFDHFVIYQAGSENGLIEARYARAVGRGRSAEAETTWGESTAAEVIHSGKILTQEFSDTTTEERLNQALVLGVPLQAGDRILGALVLIRFGNPAYSRDDINLATFTAGQCTLIIERLSLQQQLRESKEATQQSQLKETFISTITHELRSPLGFIKGYTTTLLRSDTTWDQNTQKEFLKIIDQETDHLEELIDNLLDSSRLQSGQMEMSFQPVRLDGMMNDVISRAHLHHPGLQISFKSLKNLPAIRGDASRLSQVFENLTNNAIKYAPSSPVSIKIKKEANWIHIQFQDQGPGIPKKYLPQIFQKFFRNPEQAPNVHGTGLGLYICEQIIGAHKGKIYAESQVGKGTVFHILLPLQA